jgi:AraC family transcriptional regulator
MTVDEDCTIDNVTTIAGGKFAVYRYEGFVKDIFTSFQGIFNIWLANSGYKMDERYGLDIYRSMDRENQRVVMDLCIPVK